MLARTLAQNLGVGKVISGHTANGAGTSLSLPRLLGTLFLITDNLLQKLPRVVGSIARNFDAVDKNPEAHISPLISALPLPPGRKKRATAFGPGVGSDAAALWRFYSGRLAAFSP